MPGSRHVQVPVHAAVYCRLSQDREGERLAVERQESACRDLAERLGWPVVALYVDNDVSASTGKPRPAYERMLAAVRGGTVNAVLAWHADRLYRRPLDLEALVALAEAHALSVATVQSGHIDLSTSAGRMVARMLGAAARAEVERLSERTIAGKRDAATRGGYNGGPRPFGYQIVPRDSRADGRALVVVPQEAAALRDAAARLLAGASLRTEARRMTEAGVLTVTGTPWTGSALRKVLIRATTAGFRAHHGEVVSQDACESLLDEDVYRAVGALLADPDRRTTASYERRWLLSGIARCGVCSTPLTANTTAGGGPGLRKAAYRCRAALGGVGGAAHVVRDAVALDNYVTDLVLERLSRPDAASLLAPPAPDVGPLREERRRLQTLREEDLALREAGGYSAAEFLVVTQRYRKRLDAVERALSEVVQPDVLSNILDRARPTDAWAALPLEARRAVITCLVSVTVLPRTRKGRLPGGGYFDYAAVDVDFKRG